VMTRGVKPRRGRSADAVLVEGDHRRSRSHKVIDRTRL
jgi:hypothetical protein